LPKPYDESGPSRAICYITHQPACCGAGSAPAPDRPLSPLLLRTRVHQSITSPMCCCAGSAPAAEASALLLARRTPIRGAGDAARLLLALRAAPAPRPRVPSDGTLSMPAALPCRSPRAPPPPPLANGAPVVDVDTGGSSAALGEAAAALRGRLDRSPVWSKEKVSPESTPAAPLPARLGSRAGAPGAPESGRAWLPPFRRSRLRAAARS